MNCVFACRASQNDSNHEGFTMTRNMSEFQVESVCHLLTRRGCFLDHLRRTRGRICFQHSQIAKNDWVGRNNPVMASLKDIVASFPKIQLLRDNVLLKLRPKEKLLIVTQFCLVADDCHPYKWRQVYRRHSLHEA